MQFLSPHSRRDPMQMRIPRPRYKSRIPRRVGLLTYAWSHAQPISIHFVFTGVAASFVKLHCVPINLNGSGKLQFPQLPISEFNFSLSCVRPGYFRFLHPSRLSSRLPKTEGIIRTGIAFPGVQIHRFVSMGWNWNQSLAE